MEGITSNDMLQLLFGNFAKMPVRTLLRFTVLSNIDDILSVALGYIVPIHIVKHLIYFHAHLRTF